MAHRRSTWNQDEGLGAQGLGSNVTRTCELLPNCAPRASGTWGHCAWSTCRGDTTLDKRLEHPVNSFVANCPKDATVSSSQATDSIIFERCVGVWAVQGLGSKPRFTPVGIQGRARSSPRARHCGFRTQDSRHSPRALAGLGKAASRAGLRRTAEVRPIDLEACSPSFARERLTVHQSATGAGARRPNGVLRARGRGRST